MSFVNIFNNITTTINKYCIDSYKQNHNNNVKILDLESQKYIDIIETDSDTIIIFENIPKCRKTADVDIYKYLITGCGFDRVNGLEWKRTSVYSDYEVLYRGYHKIPFTHIEQILFTNNIIKNFQFESILKMYIDCGKNYELTLTYLEV